MKVKARRSVIIAGASGTFSLEAGGEYILPDNIVDGLIVSGIVVPIYTIEAETQMISKSVDTAMKPKYQNKERKVK